MKPILGITMGDATGCGPEIIVKSLMEEQFYDISRPVVIGDAKIMERAVKIVGASLLIRKVTSMEGVGQTFGVIDVLDMDNLPADLPFAKVDARAGKAAYEYVAKGVELAMKNEIDAVVTAPLNKEAMNLGGYHYAGHTEILGELSGTKDYAMMLVGGPLRVIHVSTHVSMREACNRTKKARVLKVIELANESCKLLGVTEPRVAVAGLNPHAGEGGLFGTEEIEEIIPAIEAAKAEGICASGPIAPDTVFYRAALKEHFDIVVCMYHDQGHIPMKVLSFETGVNVTVGLPFIRTSVDHGTAFGKAGKGTADHRSMNESLLLGAKMAQTRRRNMGRGV
ncbi:MAG TPA: 4-hydroxythreonine-4-phosphate dehydrogenase PdxA [Negativicutes bacterium]|nr:4-hydroxythreonine-4-phosphate dehydrogenase PdxA [Negativicutes bacterium]